MAEQSGPADSRLRELAQLVVHPREDLSHELKGWLDLRSKEHQANLAQALLALANHGGGYIVLGIDDETRQEAPGPPDTLDKYDQGTVNGIVDRFAEPSFHCDVHFVAHPETGRKHPVIVVPGGHKSPIRAKHGGPDGKHVVADRYYIRRPGPKSEPPRSGREWEELIRRCVSANRDDLLEGIRAILGGSARVPVDPEMKDVEKLGTWTRQCLDRWEGQVNEKLPDETPSRYGNGYWHFSYAILDDFDAPHPQDLLEILFRIQGRESGWPPWITSMHGGGLKPYSDDGLIECWLRETRSADAAHSDFWRASPEGMLFLLRGYQEDCAGKHPPGTILDLTLPVWRIGECLLHAERLAKELGGADADVLFQVKWLGLEGRTLVCLSQRRFMLDDQVCRHDSVASDAIRVSAREITDALPEIVQRATSPLYTAFDFFRPPPEMYAEELARMRRGPTG